MLGLDYCDDIINGKIIAGKPVIAACKRHISDLNKAEIDHSFPYCFNNKKANRALKACRLFKHYKGEFAGQPFNPEPWQIFIIASIFGWVHEDTGFRRFNKIYIEVAKKNGKSTLAGFIANYHLIFDNEPAAEVYLVATKIEQARIVYNNCWEMFKKCDSPAVRRLVAPRYGKIYYDKTASVLAPLAADSKTQDGLNPSAAIFDEIHQWPNRKMHDIIADGIGSRRQPMIFMITTAGTSKHSFCFELHQYYESLLNDNWVKADDHFAYIANLNKGDDWKDEKNWPKANPNLGISKSIDFMKKQFNETKHLESLIPSFKTKQLNLWLTLDKGWIPAEKWDACEACFEVDALKGKKCYVGIDLGVSSDLTAISFYFPPGEVWDEGVFHNVYFTSEDNIDKLALTSRVPAELWAKNGHIITNPGDVIDSALIAKYIIDASKYFKFVKIGYDPYQMLMITEMLSKEGITMHEVRQGAKTLASPTVEFEKMVKTKKIVWSNDPVTSWMLSNVALRSDANGNAVPDKMRSADKIDGVSAMMTAYSCWFWPSEEDEPSNYETRGVVSI